MERIFASRVERLQAAMATRGVDATLLSVGSDLPYFVGYEAMPSERLTLLVVPLSGDPKMVIPELEAPRVTNAELQLLTWGDTDDPIDLVLGLITGTGRLAIGDHTRAAFLLRLQDAFQGREWLSASQLTAHLRMYKDASEIEALHTVARQADAVARRIPSEVRFGGREEREVARQVIGMLVEEGHDRGDFAIVGSGPNGASPHHEAGARRIRGGDLVVLDFGGSRGGYRSDTTRTFSVGTPSPAQAEAHAVVLTANVAGRAAVKPGVACEAVDAAARKVIEDAGYGEFFIHRTGHGIGLEVHEHPYVVAGNELALEPGMTFSIEPGIYLPGRFGVRIEDIVACVETGVESLNDSPRDLIEVG